MKRLMVLFVFLASTTISNVTISSDVAVTSATAGSSEGALVSWVVMNDEIYFCTARSYIKDHSGVVTCIKAKHEKSK
mgnify:CR=1 FL=1|jgi:hypothetical protein